MIFGEEGLGVYTALYMFNTVLLLPYWVVQPILMLLKFPFP